MISYGQGNEFAAQCQTASAPDGWRNWIDADGPIPDALAKRAKAIIDDPSVPLGATESYPLPGVTTLIRIEPRVWGRNENGDLVQGCFRAAGVYIPAGAPEGAGVASPSKSGWDRAIAVLTVASLSVGTAATLHGWSQSS